MKDGAGAVALAHEGQRASIDTPPVTGVRDTTGAGDAFNAGYLAARATGQGPGAAVRAGQRLAACALQSLGARARQDLLADFTLSD